MPLQTTVNQKQPLGIVGGRYDTSPHRVRVCTFKGTSKHCQIGRVASLAGEKEVTVGGGASATYAGLLVNPQTIPNHQNFTPTTQIAEGATVEVADMGNFVVPVADDVTAHSEACYNVTTGELQAIPADGTLPENTAKIPGATFLFTAAKGDLTVISLK